MPRPIIVNLAADGRTAEVVIRGFVGGWSANLEDIDARINGLDVDLIVARINTLGGLAHEGIAIHNILRAHKARVQVIVEGVAGSAGSIIAMAGDEIEMYANTVMMIHGSRAVDEWGDELDTPEAREMVRVWNEGLIETYAARSGKSEGEIRAMLPADKWMTAREAVAAGFADRVIELTAPAESDAVAHGPLFALAAAIEIPADVLARAQAEAAVAPEPATSKGGDPHPAPSGSAEADPEPVVETFAARINALAAGAGLGEYVAAWLLDGGITSEAQAREAIAEAREVRDLCAFANAAEQAGGFIRARKTLAEVRAQLINARADAADARHTDGHPKTHAQAHQTGAAVWAKIFPTRQTKE